MKGPLSFEAKKRVFFIIILLLKGNNDTTAGTANTDRLDTNYAACQIQVYLPAYLSSESGPQSRLRFDKG